MSVSLSRDPQTGDVMSGAYLHSMIDNGNVHGLEENAFADGNILFIQKPTADSPVTPPFLCYCTAPTLSSDEVLQHTTLDVLCFSGAHRQNWALGWHVYAAPLYNVSAWRRRGDLVRLLNSHDVRASGLTYPWHGTAQYDGAVFKPFLPAGILESDDLSTGPTFRAVTVHGLTMANVRNPDSGHTMLPNQPLYMRQEESQMSMISVLYVFNASAYSMPAGYLAGLCLGHSVDATEALLPVQFWPYGLLKMPAKGWVKA